MMNVWIVTNGTGGQIDSVWDSSGAAHARADVLNLSTFEIAWTVVEMAVRQTG